MDEGYSSTGSLDKGISNIMTASMDNLNQLGEKSAKYSKGTKEYEESRNNYYNFIDQIEAKVGALANQRQFYLHPSKWVGDISIIFNNSGKDKVSTWSANRNVRANDIFLFYYPKNGPKANLAERTDLNIIDQFPLRVSTLVLNSPASIYAMCRCISNPFLIKNDPDFKWRVFVSEFIFFDIPVLVEELSDQKRIMFMGGLFSPRRFPLHGTLLTETKNLILKWNSELKYSYLQFSNYWNDNFPTVDDKDWLEKIKRVSERAFLDENMVKEYFIIPLLGKILATEYDIDAEYPIEYDGKGGSIDYVIKKQKTIIPIEAKFDIEHQIEKRYFDQIIRYIRAVSSDFGLLIDRNSICVINKAEDIIFKANRIQLCENDLRKLKELITLAE